MGRITSKRQRTREPFRPTLVPRNVDRSVWLQAHHHRQHPSRLKLEELPEDERPGYRDPTPEEIAEACALLQAGWHPLEERARRMAAQISLREVEAANEWRAPEVALAELIGAIAS